MDRSAMHRLGRARRTGFVCFASKPGSARPRLFELTRAFDLACRHCRAEAMADPDPDELSTGAVKTVLADLGWGPPRAR